jgi:hypothetical protein
MAEDLVIVSEHGITTEKISCRGRLLSADEYTTDVFVKRRGTWQCVHDHIAMAKEKS